MALMRERAIDVIGVAHRDRLVRFASGYLEAVSGAHGRRGNVADAGARQDDLVRGMVDGLTAFWACLSGRRGAKNRVKLGVKTATGGTAAASALAPSASAVSRLPFNTVPPKTLARAAGTARFAWNRAWATWRRRYRSGRRSIKAALRRALNTHKRSAWPWLRERRKGPAQQAIKDLGTAGKRFISRGARKPTFEKKA